jgi:hypothetical protein
MRYTHSSTRAALSPAMRERIDAIKAILADENLEEWERWGQFAEACQEVRAHIGEESEAAQVLVMDGLAAVGVIKVGEG